MLDSTCMICFCSGCGTEPDDAEKYFRAIRRAQRDLNLPGLSRNRVLAAVVLLLDRTFIRIGNEEYAQQNGSFGLTTLRNRHVTVKGATVRFLFKGKSGRQVEVGITDPKVARIVKRCEDLPGQKGA